jgi:hypothetical protein
VAARHHLHLPDGRTLSSVYFPGPIQPGDSVRVDGDSYEVGHALTLVTGADGSVVRAWLRRPRNGSERKDE